MACYEASSCVCYHSNYMYRYVCCLSLYSLIRDQGVQHVFYECDTHMWRLAERHVPRDIIWSGGSDWICLNKQFCDYIITSEDDLVRGLKHYHEYSLLPAEVSLPQ